MRKYVIVLLLCITLGITGYDLYGNWQEKKLNEEIHDIYEDARMEDEIRESTITAPTETEDTNDNKDKFKELLRINDDIIGWITIPNTTIDYPVVQGTDNDFYLKHNVRKQENKAGSIFLDFRNKTNELSKNTIIYGHYMKNKTMFYDLVKYKDQQFYNDNRIIHFSTLQEDMEWEIFSVYETDISFNYIKESFASRDEFARFLDTINNKSMYPNDTTVSIDHNILTLSTCSYIFDNARLVVHAKRIS
ncbi:class B sortase [Radiobacillus sp. PE A8.2]|uniref:class B sortase n=1 Tax=Radiobacillus sp. PE A8.2 TaxID=3380349 RepID=UPI00388D9CA0